MSNSVDYLTDAQYDTSRDELEECYNEGAMSLVEYRRALRELAEKSMEYDEW